MKYTGYLISIVGAILIIWYGSWQLMLGIFLLMWGDNIDKREKFYENG